MTLLSIRQQLSLNLWRNAWIKHLFKDETKDQSGYCVGTLGATDGDLRSNLVLKWIEEDGDAMELQLNVWDNNPGVSCYTINCINVQEVTIPAVVRPHVLHSDLYLMKKRYLAYWTAWVTVVTEVLKTEEIRKWVSVQKLINFKSHPLDLKSPQTTADFEKALRHSSRLGRFLNVV